jgi:hypothetical protein
MPSVAGSKVPLVSTEPFASSSMTRFGGTRPPAPSTVAAGRLFPVERSAIEGEISSVVVRLFTPSLPPGRNSLTVPVTWTEAPTVTVGAESVKTRMPSEVASTASGVGPCIQKPFDRVAVTMPAVSTS